MWNIGGGWLGSITTDDLLGTTNEITVTDNGDGTLTISLTDPSVMPGDLRLADNKKIELGDSQDYDIYFNGTNARFDTGGEGTRFDGSIGLGVAPNPRNALNVQLDHTGDVFYGIRSAGTWTPTAGASLGYGFLMATALAGAVDVTTFAMIAAVPVMGGIYTGTVTNLNGIRIAPVWFAEVNKLTNFHGIYINPLLLTGATNYYGLYIEDATYGGTLNYALFINSGLVHFGDDVEILSDSKKLLLGAANDMGLHYDGTDGQIDTSLVGASDLLLTCGANKTLEFQNVIWDDLQVNISSVRLPASASPTWTPYKGSQVLSFSKSADNIIHFAAQLPHSYKPGEDIEFHLHLAYPNAGTGDIRWNFTHSWANLGSDFPGETTVTTDIASPNDADNHQYAEIAATIDGTGKAISSVLLCSLEREGSDAVNDDYDDVVYLVALDFHFPKNTVGSRQETVK